MAISLEWNTFRARSANYRANRADLEYPNEARPTAYY
jgi:hypothetical protein